MPIPVVRFSVALAALLMLGAGSLALAAGPGDDHAVAESLLTELASDSHKGAAADPMARAKDALERARRMRTAGDELHASLADGLARRWAETARDVVKAAALEESSAKMRGDALDAGAGVERDRLQLEEALARVGRLRAQLEQTEREAREQGRTAQPVDAGAPPPKRSGASKTRGNEGKP